MSDKIGIGITTRNRPEIFAKTRQEIRKYAPRNSKLVIVDDASDVPVVGATFRFEKNAGIAAAKNKALEFLDDCDHIFLFDDDTYPLMFNWHKSYVDSPEPHLMYQFKLPSKSENDMRELYRDDSVVAYSHTRGCMLYIKKIVLEVVGGMDTRYFVMSEHTDWTNRIHNAGLTTHRAMDVVGSDKLLYCLDQDGAVETTIPSFVRIRNVKRNRPLYLASKTSRELKEYK